MFSKKKLVQVEARRRLQDIVSKNKYQIVEPFEYKGDRKTEVRLFCEKHQFNWKASWHSIVFRYNSNDKYYTGCKYCRIIYTKDECQKIALKCKYRSEFSSKYKGYYFAALRNGWLDEICKHMSVLGNKYFRCIYSYEFPDINSKNYVYIGLTDSLEYRDKIHSQRGSVFNFCKKNNIKKPDIKQLTKYIDKEEASRLEGEILDKYISKGWIAINKAKTGGLGGNLKFKNLSFKECMFRAKFYKNRTEWKQKDYSSYYIATKHGWIDKIKKQKEKFGNSFFSYWTYEKCAEEALKYSSIKDFRKNCSVAYATAAKRKWLDDITIHMHKKIVNHHFTVERILKLIDGYDSITAFYKANPSIKNWCHKNGIKLKEYTDKGFEYKGAVKKKIFQFDKSGKFVREYESAREACNFGFDYKKISAVCNGRNKTHKGYIFSFSNDFNEIKQK